MFLFVLVVWHYISLIVILPQYYLKKLFTFHLWLVEIFNCVQINKLQEEVKHLKKDDLKMKILSQKNISRLEKLRGNIIQQIFSTEGAVRPDVLIEDEHLIRLVKKVSICFLDNVAEREEVSPWKAMFLFFCPCSIFVLNTTTRPNTDATTGCWKSMLYPFNKLAIIICLFIIYYIIIILLYNYYIIIIIIIIIL